MAIANPLVITLGGSGGTAKTLPKINQDAYGSEYYLREATQEFRVKIRHSRESANAAGVILERHNLEITQTVFGVAGAPDTVRQAYVVLRNSKTDTLVDITNVGTALSFYMDATHWGDLVGWVN
jgi:hypothetical protein